MVVPALKVGVLGFGWNCEVGVWGVVVCCVVVKWGGGVGLLAVVRGLLRSDGTHEMVVLCAVELLTLEDSWKI